MAESVDLRWDTSRVRLDERFSYFVEGICRAFTHLDPEFFDPESAFFARIHHREAGGSAVTHLTSSRYISRRLPAGIARSPDHNFYLNFIASGTIHGRQAGQDETVSQGDIFILDNGSPFELVLRSDGMFDSHVVRLRRARSLEDRGAGLLDFGRRHAGHRLMPILRMNLIQLARTGDAGSEAEIEYFGAAAERLVELILSGDSVETVPSRSGEAWRIIRAEIDRHIADPEFSLTDLATRLGVSPRYVQKICAAQDCTFSEYLRERKLSLAARRLEKGGRHASIDTIARDSGFRDPSTFYRSFKRRYGTTPGRYRH